MFVFARASSLVLCPFHFPTLTIRVLVMRNELDAAPSALRDGRLVLIHHFQEKTQSRVGGKAAKFPRTRTPDSDF